MKQKGKNRSQFRKNSNKFRTSEKKKRKKPRANISFECVHEAISVERQRVDAISTSPDFIARIKSRMNSRGNAMYKSANINAYPFRILLVITVPYVSFPTWQRQFATPNRTGYLMLVALCLLDPWRTIELRPLNRPRGAFHGVHTLVSRRLFAGYVDIYVYTMYIYICVCVYHPPWKFNILQEQIIWTVTRALYFLPRWNAASFSACTITPLLWSMKTYGSIFQAETEGTICPVKESYYTEAARKSCRFTIEEGRRKGMDYWKR